MIGSFHAAMILSASQMVASGVIAGGAHVAATSVANEQSNHLHRIAAGY